LPTEHPKLEQLIIDFDKLPQRTEFVSVQDVYCCLGTTMKKAGSKEAFRKVDYTYPFNLAKLAAEKGASQFMLISALGANKGSLFFYNRVKGEVEEAISKISQYSAVHIFRPSLLLGDRNENRTGEKVGEVAMRILKPIMLGPLKNIRPIKAKTVAQGMFAAAQSGQRGVHLYPTSQIKELARKGEL
jgi:uncharacterized protein YbjT (DUF2867 family)